MDLNNLTPDLAAKVQKARQAGYSDAEIQSYLSSRSQKQNTVGAVNDFQQVSPTFNSSQPTPTPNGQTFKSSVNQAAQEKPALNGYGYSNDRPITDMNGNPSDGSMPTISPNTGKTYKVQPKQKEVNMKTLNSDSLAQETGKQKATNFLVDQLPTIGGVAGGIGGGLVGEGVGAIPGAIAGGAAGERARQHLKGENADYKKVAMEGALSGAGEGAGKVLGGVGKFVFGKAGELLTKEGEGLAVKSIRPSASQLTNYAKRYGEDITKTLTDNNLAGKGVDEIENTIRPLQDSFNSIVGKSDVSVNPSTLDANFYAKIKPLLESTDSDDHKLAQSLLDQYESITKQLGDNPTLSALNKARQDFDSKVNYNLASQDINKYGEKKLIADALRKSVQDTADEAGLVGAGGQSLKDTGMNISKLKALQDIAIRNSNKGRGSAMTPILTTLLDGGAGAVIGTTLGAGPVGLGTGLVAGAVLNNPKAIGLLSRMATSTGEKLGGASVPKAAQTVIGQGAVRTGENLLMPSTSSGNNIGNNQNNNYSSDNSHALNIPQNGAVSQDNQGHLQLAPLTPKTVNQDYTYDQYIADLEKPENKYVGANRSVIEAKYKASQDRANSSISSSGLAPEDKSFMDHAKNSAAALDRASDLITKIGTSPIYANKTLKWLREQKSGDAAALDALLSRLSTLSEKSAVGGKLSNFDIAMGSTFLPTSTDTVTAAMGKLNQAKEMLANEYNIYYPKYGLTTGRSDIMPSISP